jgi:hypothetical protein
VIGIAVDDQDLDLGGSLAWLVALARRADRGPQAGKAGAEDENARHVLSSRRVM